MGKWSTHLRCYIPLGRKWFLFVVSLSYNKLWTMLLVSRGEHGVSCYCIEDCYNSNSTCVGNGLLNYPSDLWLLTALRLRCSNHPLYSPDVASSNLNLFWLLQKHLFGIRITTDANLKQAVIFWLQTLDNYCFCTGIQALVSWWNQCLHLSFEYVNSDVYHLLPMPYLYIEVRITSSALRYNAFFKLLCTYYIR